MPAICQIGKKDVAKCVQHMNEHNMMENIFQTGNTTYHQIEQNRTTASEKAKVREYNRIVDMDTETLHTLKCKKVGERTVNASIVANHDADTGLNLCACVKRAMKK